MPESKFVGCLLTSQQQSSVSQGRICLTSQQQSNVSQGRICLTSQQHASVSQGRICLTSQQHASISQGRICSDKCTCCHTEIGVSDQTFYLTQSQHTDTGPTRPSTDPRTPGTWQGSHWSASCVSRWYDSARKKSLRCKRESNPESSTREAHGLTTRPRGWSSVEANEGADRLSSTTDITRGLQMGKTEVLRGLRDFLTPGAMVSTSAFLAFHQCCSAGSSLGWGLNFGL